MLRRDAAEQHADINLSQNQNSLIGGKDYHMLPDGRWQQHPANKRVLISPVRGEGMLIVEGESVVRQQILTVFIFSWH